MSTHSKLALLSIAAAMFLATAVSLASASRLSISSTSFRLTWDRNVSGATDLTFAATVGEAVTCAVTVEGTFHSQTITKTRGLLLGYVTRASVGTNGSREANCAGGSITISTETLPWHLAYESFGGTLPNITSATFSLTLLTFQMRNSAATCVVRATAGEPAAGIVEVANPTTTREILFIRADETRRIRLREGSFGCGLASGFYGGTAAVTVLEGSARPSLRLI